MLFHFAGTLWPAVAVQLANCRLGSIEYLLMPDVTTVTFLLPPEMSGPPHCAPTPIPHPAK